MKTLIQRAGNLRQAMAGLFLMLVLSLGFSHELAAQGTSAQATVSRLGFGLSKVESNTTINSGQTFSYTIQVMIPVGATNVIISDQLPANLQFLSVSMSHTCTAPPIVVSTPIPNNMGGLYQLSVPSEPNGATISITFVMRFPLGTTCNGETARNNVCLTGRTEEGQGVDICTEHIVVTAVATNPWHVSKRPLNVAYIGGPCPYAAIGPDIEYEVQVWKDLGTTGQMNLVNGVVTDNVPPGATLVSSTCGATQPGGPGTPIIWNVGNLNISPTNPIVTSTCIIKINYPPGMYPAGSNVFNSANLTGTLGSLQKPCGQVNTPSNQTCVTIKQVIKGQFYKDVWTTGQPGCPGTYTIRFCNTGNVPLFSYNITDAIPAAIGPFTVSVSPGLTYTLSGLNLTATNTTQLNPGQCVTITINFTIPLSAVVGSTINNCATVNITNPALPSMTDCAQFMVNAAAPRLCVWKQVCNKQYSYNPGQTFRYRLVLWNAGGLAISGATITDVLNPNLQYTGNPVIYTSPTWPGACVTSGTAIPVSYSGGAGGTITIPNINVAPNCNSWGNCGQYSGPYVVIEFDVQIIGGSVLGNIPNTFRVTGGNVPGTVTSNTEYVLVVGTAAIKATKGVRQFGTSNPFVSSLLLTTPLNPNLEYRVQTSIIGSASLRYVTVGDELPRNNGLADRLILGSCASRGSQFDINYAGSYTAAPGVFSLHNMGVTADPNVNGMNFPPVGAVFTNGCGTQMVWGAGMAAGNKNIAWHYGSTAIAGSVIDFRATVSPAAQPNQTACNTAAVNGALTHLINGTTLLYQLAAPGGFETPKACVRIPVPPIERNCCELFIKGVKVNYTTRWAGAGVDNVAMNLSFAPNKRIKKATFTIVSASRRMLPFGAWQRIFGDVTSATPIAPLGSVFIGQQAPSSSFNAPSWMTREIAWGNLPAGPGLLPATTVNMVFPTAPTWPSKDDLRYFVRIAMTDTSCVTCDTLVEVRMTRQNYWWHPWPDVPVSTTPTIAMATRDNGTLTVRVPDNTSGEDNIQVVAVGFKADAAVTYATGFTCESGNFTPVPPSPDEEDTDGALYCQGSMGNGEQAIFNVGFNNPLADNWNNTVIIKYRLNGGEEIYAEEVTVASAAPVYGEGDKLAELDNALTNVRTYALWFENANAAGHAIKNVQLHLPDGVNLLAYGSGLNNNQKLEATASFDADGNKIQNYLIPVQDADRAASTITTGETVTPIYITVSGGADVIDLGFTTIDEGGSTMTNGTVQLTSPVYIISGGQQDNGDDNNVQSSVPAPGIEEPKPSMIMNVYPNPATNSATINLGVESKETVSMTVSDIHGREVTVLCNESMLYTGNHIFTLNTTGLTDGTYLIVAKNQNGEVVTTQLKVVK